MRFFTSLSLESSNLFCLSVVLFFVASISPSKLLASEDDALLLASDDDALDAIVSLVASAPNDEAILERATLWAQNQGRILDLIDGLAENGISNSSQSSLSAAVSIATAEGWMQKTVEILESSLEVKDLPSADQIGNRLLLSRLWLFGGWPEQARRIAGDQLDTSAFIDIRLGLVVLSEEFPSDTITWASLVKKFPPKEISNIDNHTIRMLALRSGHWQWAADLFEERGDQEAALEMSILGANAEDCEKFLEQGVRIDDPLLRLQLARLLGKKAWQNEPLVDDTRETGRRWRASIGLEGHIFANPARSQELPLLQPALQQLENDQLQAARRTVALWRMAGGGETRHDISTRLILDQLKPAWLGPDQLPESIEQRLRRSSTRRDSDLAERAALRAVEGSPIEAKLWFHVGRLAQNPQSIERSIRIWPGGTVAFEWLPGIEARWRQPLPKTNWSNGHSAQQPGKLIENPGRFLPDAQLPASGALLGSAHGNPIRRPGQPPIAPSFSLQYWQVSDQLPAIPELKSVVQIRICDNGWLQGDEQSLQAVEATSSADQVRLELIPIDGEPLLNADGIPRTSILTALFSTYTTHRFGNSPGNQSWEQPPNENIDPTELLRVAPAPPPLPPTMQAFAEAATRRVREPSQMQWINFRPGKENTWWVDVAGVSGLFATTAVTPAAKVLPAQQIPSSRKITPPDPIPQQDLILKSTRRHGQQPTASRPVVEDNEAPDPLLPAGEQLLLTAGNRDRVVVTDSGLVGYFESGAARALWWKQILQPPLAGVGGFATPPMATVEPQLPWADSVTPRLIEVIDAEGASRFLLLATGVHLIDAHQVKPIVRDDLPAEGFAGATLDVEGQLQILDATGQYLVTAQKRYPLPRKGAYQLIATKAGTFILGQEQGQTWLGHLDGELVKEISPPPLPDEKDRPNLRVAALGRWGDEVLLLADRLWLLDPMGSSHRALTAAPTTGNYRPVHWVQTPPRVEKDVVRISRPWGVVEIWRAP